MKTCVLALLALLPLVALSGPEDVLRKRMSEIIIPVIEMENATVRELIDYLRQQAKARDIDGDGINLFVQASKERLDRTVTVSFRNIPLRDALDSICSGSGLYHKVEGHVVLVKDKTERSQTDNLQTRMYPVKGTFRELLKKK
jgi:general secretion pathway protein D